jgi:hypothetical protein
MAGNKTRKRHGRGIATVLPVVLGLVSPAVADSKPTYDKRIEEAAIRMLLPKLGDMRGPLGLKSNEYLRPLANQRVIEHPQAAMIPKPVERPRSPENRRVVGDRKIHTGRQGVKNPPADRNVQATRDPQLIENRAAEQTDPVVSRRSKGSFLFF